MAARVSGKGSGKGLAPLSRNGGIAQQRELQPEVNGSSRGKGNGKGHRLRRGKPLEEYSYTPQVQRSMLTPAHPDVPTFDSLPNDTWTLLAEADARQRQNMAVATGPDASQSGLGELDKDKFIADFKEKLAQSQEVKLTLKDHQFEGLADAASQQPNIKSFEDFPYFDFNHESMDDVNVNVRIANQLQAFQAEMAKTSKSMISFASSRYREVYTDRETLRAKTPEEAWALVHEFLHHLAGKPGFSAKTIAGRHEFFEKVHAESFYSTLRSQFQRDGFPLVSQDGDSEERIGWCAGETLVRCWTLANLCTPLQREWCSLLQQGVRMNDPDLTHVVARIWATMNVYCVANRKDGDAVRRSIAWPGESVPRNPEEEFRVLHRGARIHPNMLEWWDEAVETMEVFRVPGAVAASKLASKALHFMWQVSRPEELDRVYYRIHLHPLSRQPCDHAVCLDTVSVLPEEQEFLFPPFSSFQAISKRWLSPDGEEGYWIIDLAAVKNNMDVSPDVPLCAWL